MSTTSQLVDNGQYNQIVDVYSTLYPAHGEAPADFPLAEVESHQVYLAVTDPTIDIRGKRVLDLACGNGYHANKLLDWGASSVTGMDVSTGMLEAARQNAQDRGIGESRLNFVHGDATDEVLLMKGAPFDLITGCWLLNYAPDAAPMTKMYKFIARNLRPGGYWVGLTIPPLLSAEDYELGLLNEALQPHGAWGRYGQGGRVLKAMPHGDGYLVRCELGTEAHKVKATFECYSLSLKVSDQACKDSDEFKSPEWRDFVVPRYLKDAHDNNYWNALSLRPSCTVVTAQKYL